MLPFSWVHLLSEVGRSRPSGFGRVLSSLPHDLSCSPPGFYHSLTQLLTAMSSQALEWRDENPKGPGPPQGEGTAEDWSVSRADTCGPSRVAYLAVLPSGFATWGRKADVPKIKHNCKAGRLAKAWQAKSHQGVTSGGGWRKFRWPGSRQDSTWWSVRDVFPPELTQPPGLENKASLPGMHWLLCVLSALETPLCTHPASLTARGSRSATVCVAAWPNADLKGYPVLHLWSASKMSLLTHSVFGQQFLMNERRSMCQEKHLGTNCGRLRAPWVRVLISMILA